MADSTASTVLNKIIIPVITTVLGATAIYFLGFNRKGGSSSANPEEQKALVVKEATVNAWKSFVTSQNIAHRNMTSITNEYAERINNVSVDLMQQKSFKPIAHLVPEFKNELVRESKKAIKDIDEILSIVHIDKDFINMLNRTRENTLDQEKKAVAFFNELEEIINANLAFEEKQQQWGEASNRFSEMVAGVEKRAATEAEDIAKILTEKYEHKFNMNDLLVYVEYMKEQEEEKSSPKPLTNERPAPADPRRGIEYVPDEKEEKKSVEEPGFPVTKKWVTGKWKMTRGLSGHIDLAADGSLYWEFKDKGYTSGDWKWNNGIITMNATNPETGKKVLMVGDISAATATSFTLTLRSIPKEIYYFKK